MKVLILGANGMIGSEMLRSISENKEWQVSGTIRNEEVKKKLPDFLGYNLISGVDVSNFDNLLQLFSNTKPNVVINCAGLTKHLPLGSDPIPALTINSLLPHRLHELCKVSGARLVHVSTDCVFSGKVGMYQEGDTPDAEDIYGKSKHLGEVTGDIVVTLRTSTIGHEKGTRFGLLEWFLTQRECKGYRQAIFSGLPTVEFSRVVRDIVIPNSNLSGIYHVGASPIDKDSLLRLIARQYRQNIMIIPDDTFRINRSLNVNKFAEATGYRSSDWPSLIALMNNDQS